MKKSISFNDLSQPLIDAAAQKFLDQSFTAQTGLPSLVLMEQAASKVTSLIRQLIPSGSSVLFLAGSGNNGGDAWACARQLMAYDYLIEVLEVFPTKDTSLDASQNRQAYIQLGGTVVYEVEDFGQYQLVVDGIFGTGFSSKKSLTEDLAQLIDRLNQEKDVIKMAIDIPTGIESDTGACDEFVFQADHTVTFSARKIGMVAEPGCAYVGQIHLAPISMQPDWLEWKLKHYQSNSNNLLPRALTNSSFQSIDLNRDPLSHKGSHGKTLLIGGSKEMIGAMVLASGAAQATGVGYVYLRTPVEIVPDLLKVTPESLIDTIPKTSVEWMNLLKLVDSVAIGPGAGEAEWLNESLEMICQQSNRLIIDADALNYLSQLGNWEQLLRRRVETRLSPAILTPHLGEFKRLAPDLTEILKADRQQAASLLARRSSSIIVLKGHATVIALPSGETYINTSGNAALARAGSGDVLTGLMAGFLAQLDNLTQAVCLAVFFHGLLADLAVVEYDNRGVLPSRLVENAPQAFRELLID